MEKVQYKYPDGSVYNGQWKFGKKHGLGHTFTRTVKRILGNLETISILTHRKR